MSMSLGSYLYPGNWVLPRCVLAPGFIPIHVLIWVFKLVGLALPMGHLAYDICRFPCLGFKHHCVFFDVIFKSWISVCLEQEGRSLALQLFQSSFFLSVILTCLQQWYFYSFSIRKQVQWGYLLMVTWQEVVELRTEGIPECMLLSTNLLICFGSLL